MDSPTLLFSFIGCYYDAPGHRVFGDFLSVFSDSFVSLGEFNSRSNQAFIV